MEIPIGFRFTPTDDELVNYYLKNKVMGNLPPYFMFTERDIYGEESPWNIFNDNDPWFQKPGEKTKSLYNFASLNFKGKNKEKTELKRFARKAGNGTWNGVTGSKDIVDRVSGAVIGKTQMFSYVSGDQSLRGFKGHWYMHEYALPDSSLNTVEGRSSLSSYVLCKITRDDNKSLHIEDPPSETKKKRKGAHVSDQEVTANTGMMMNTKFLGENCSTVCQPDLQYNANDDFLDGFSKEVEQMLMDGDTDLDLDQELQAIWLGEDDQEYQGAPDHEYQGTSGQEVTDNEANTGMMSYKHYGLTTNDPDLEHASKRMRSESFRIS